MKKIIAICLLVLNSSLVFGQANGLAISNKASGGAIGTAAATVDVASLFNVNQTTASQTLTVPSLTNTTNGKTIHINNVGSVSFTLLGKTVETGTGIILRWTGSGWSISGVGNATGGGGGSGDIDGVTAGVGLTGGGTTGTVTLNADTASVLATIYDVSQKVDKSGSKVLSDENYTTAEKSKLSGIASGATANSTDATLLNRANHTGTQSYTTITGLGGAANLNVGTTVSTVAAGDDSRFTEINSNTQAALDLKANLASPALTGTPTAPTATVGDNSTKIATTAFVTAAVAGGGGSSALTNGHVFVGNASNVATDVAMSGDVAISNTGVTSFPSVTGSGSVVKATSPIFTTNITSPIVYGSSSASGTLLLQATSNATQGNITMNGLSCLFQTSGTQRLGISSTTFNSTSSIHNFFPVALTTGSAPHFQFATASQTSRTASTQVNEMLLDFSLTQTWAGSGGAGTVTEQNSVLLKAPTYAFAGTNTMTTASTFTIDKAPVAGTNATITNPYAFWVKAGLSRLDGGLTMTTAGSGISIKTGANCTANTATLSSGTVTVSNTKVTANSLIFLQTRTASGTLGTLSYTISPGTSFTVTSTSALDNSTFNWWILEPN